MLLEILEKFHGYLMKYVTMIIRGTTPPLHSAPGKDSKLRLRTLIPRNTPVTRDSLNAACKMLHLAFKVMTTEDIYDTLAYCFMRAARRYDPYFTDKMKSICEAIHALPTSFKQAQLETRMVLTALAICATSFVRDTLRASPARRRSWPIGRVQAGRRRRSSFSQVLSDLCMSFRCGSGTTFMSPLMGTRVARIPCGASP
jgi:hypothetical protein